MSRRSSSGGVGGRRLARTALAAAFLGAMILAGGRSTDHAVASPAAFTLGRLPGAREVSVPQAQNDSAAVAATVERFHAALAAGDSTAALALLAPDVVILESGGVETRDEYRAHHLPADIAFARGVKGERGPLRITVRGDVAWASGTSVTQGEYRGRQVNSAGAELAVLTRTPQGWRIAALHWSSRTRRPPG